MHMVSPNAVRPIRGSGEWSVLRADLMSSNGTATSRTSCGLLPFCTHCLHEAIRPGLQLRGLLEYGPFGRATRRVLPLDGGLKVPNAYHLQRRRRSRSARYTVDWWQQGAHGAWRLRGGGRA